MLRWLSPPQIEDEYGNFLYSVFHYTLLLFIAIMLAIIPFAQTPEQFLFMPPVMAVLVIAFYLLQRHRLRLSALLFIGGLWLIVTVAIYMQNGVRNSSIPLYVIIIIYTALVFTTRTVVIVTLACILSVVMLGLGQAAGVLPLRYTQMFLFDRVSQPIAIFSGSCILLAMASRTIRTSYERIREHEQTLLERNAALEAEIQERKRIEATLRASEERYRILFDSTDVMSVVYEADGTVRLMNAAAKSVLGDIANDVENLFDPLALSEDDRQLVVQYPSTEHGMQRRISETQILLPDGRKVDYLRAIIPLPHPSGEPHQSPQILVMATDVTAVKESERAEQALAQATERSAFLTDFLSTISHDLKTPLSVMNTSLHLLGRATDSAMREQKIQQIKEQTELINRYIQDMLMISRLQYLPELKPEDVNADSLIEEILRLLRARCEAKSITCHHERGHSGAVIRADREQLHRALLNLIENAVTYTPAGGEVRVKTEQTLTGTSLEISDSGVGIRADYLPHIFEPFYRSPDVRRSFQTGTGLGLSIVKKVVEAHQASIDVQSTLGEGTTFRIHFPRIAVLRAEVPDDDNSLLN
jgi:PAS domain S-box-containing protein